MSSLVRGIIFFAGLVFCLPPLTSAALAQTPEAKPSPNSVGALEVRQKEPFGSYLTDNQGRALYTFERDVQGSGESVCYAACADAWPPALGDPEQVKLGAGLDRSQLSSVVRKDGGKQLTYAGWPLYYFSRDTAPGDTSGQDVTGFGGEWFLLAPNGAPITTEVPE